MVFGCLCFTSYDLCIHSYTKSNGKCGYPLGEYPKFVPPCTYYIHVYIYTLYIYIDTGYGLYRALGGRFREQTSRVLSQGVPTFSL